jgi:hypothetical protein
MDKGPKAFAAHFHTDKLGSLRAGRKKCVKIIITAQRNAFIDPQHISDLVPCFGFSDREDSRRTQLPGTAPKRPDILPVLRAVNPYFKIAKVISNHFFSQLSSEN